MVYRKISTKSRQVISLEEREKMRQDIHQAFEFLRYLISNPKEIKHLKNNSEIHFTRNDVELRGKHSRIPKLNYTTETIFHRV